MVLWVLRPSRNWWPFKRNDFPVGYLPLPQKCENVRNLMTPGFWSKKFFVAADSIKSESGCHLPPKSLSIKPLFCGEFYRSGQRWGEILNFPPLASNFKQQARTCFRSDFVSFFIFCRQIDFEDFSSNLAPSSLNTMLDGSTCPGWKMSCFAL